MVRRLTSSVIDGGFDSRFKVDIQYLGFEATDQMNFDLSVYFEKGADFIEKGLNMIYNVLRLYLNYEDRTSKFYFTDVHVIIIV
jgi:hypothetical protein